MWLNQICFLVNHLFVIHCWLKWKEEGARCCYRRIYLEVNMGRAVRKEKRNGKVFWKGEIVSWVCVVRISSTSNTPTLRILSLLQFVAVWNVVTSSNIVNHLSRRERESVCVLLLLLLNFIGVNCFVKKSGSCLFEWM